MITFHTLGGFELMTDGIDLSPTAQKVRQVFALLVTRANHVVPVDTIITELWDDQPPASASTTLQTYIHQIRRLLCSMNVGPTMLTTRGPGYILRVDPAAIDELRFRDLVQRATEALTGDEPGIAHAAANEALTLWTGEPLADIVCGRVLAAHVLSLQELHTRAIEIRIESAMLMGKGRDLVAELRLLVSNYPYNEWLHGKLIQCLAQAGRRNDALEAYQAMRLVLDEDLGLLPSPDLRQIHTDLLSA